MEMFESTQKQLIKRLLCDPVLEQRLERFTSIDGVGPITALTWALEVADPHRFSSTKLCGTGTCGTVKMCPCRSLRCLSSSRVTTKRSVRTRKSWTDGGYFVPSTPRRIRRDLIHSCPHSLQGCLSSRLRCTEHVCAVAMGLDHCVKP